VAGNPVLVLNKILLELSSQISAKYGSSFIDVKNWVIERRLLEIV